MIAGFRPEVDGNCALPGYSAASSGNSLPTFRDNLSVPSSGVKNPRRKSAFFLDSWPLSWRRQVVPKRW